MIEMGQKKPALTVASKPAHCCSQGAPTSVNATTNTLLATDTHTHTCVYARQRTTLNIEERDGVFSGRPAVMSDAKSSGAKGQTVCDKTEINGTKTPQGEITGRCYVSGHVSFGRRKEA